MRSYFWGFEAWPEFEPWLWVFAGLCAQWTGHASIGSTLQFAFLLSLVISQSKDTWLFKYKGHCPSDSPSRVNTAQHPLCPVSSQPCFPTCSWFVGSQGTRQEGEKDGKSEGQCQLPVGPVSGALRVPDCKASRGSGRDAVMRTTSGPPVWKHRSGVCHFPHHRSVRFQTLQTVCSRDVWKSAQMDFGIKVSLWRLEIRSELRRGRFPMGTEGAGS